MKLVKISENAYFIPGAINIGVIKTGESVVLIDTGIDRESGRRVLRTIEKSGLAVGAIINTHSHADHFGGNGYLIRNTNAKVYAPEIEAGVIQYPYLEPLYLFSAHPVRDLMNRFLMAEPSRVDFILKDENFSRPVIELKDAEIEIIPLFGHSPRQIGVEIDGVLYCADSVFSSRIIQKYRIPLFMDIEKQKRTLSLLEKSNYDYYVPCHANPTDDISELIDMNMKVIESVEELLISCKNRTTEEVLKMVCSKYGIRLTNFTEYCLMHSTIKAYLSCLYNRGDLNASFDGEILVWNPQ